MGYFPVRYDSRVVNYDRRGFTRLATEEVQTERQTKWVARVSNRKFLKGLVAKKFAANILQGCNERTNADVWKSLPDIIFSILLLSLRLQFLHS